MRISTTLTKSRECVMLYEDFVRGADFLDEREKNLLLITGNEICDNLITHGEVGPRGICVRIHKKSDLVMLAFFVESHDVFCKFAACMDTIPQRSPRFDEAENRWHGLGLTMCTNLARKIRYRPGSLVDRIFLEFAPS